jgi:hypothetical protein
MQLVFDDRHSTWSASMRVSQVLSSVKSATQPRDVQPDRCASIALLWLDVPSLTRIDLLLNRPCSPDALKGAWLASIKDAQNPKLSSLQHAH